MKIITNYLPQYHEIEINNYYYGKGYTEWTAVKDTKPLFEGHEQPKVPINNNYYSLLDINTIKWQTKLAKKYGITTFAFYHYFFDSNTKLLERPAELLLENSSIDIEYFFIWANESWGRGLPKDKINRWTSKFDKGLGNDIFCEQKYEGLKQYERHYNYIRKFIDDPRYMKIDGKAVFAIYNTEKIKDIKIMINCWNRMGKMDGYLGFYFIGINSWENNDLFDAVLFQTPNSSYHYGVPSLEIKNNVVFKGYNQAYNNILSINKTKSNKNYYGAFVNFDNTPRYGKNHSLVMLNYDIQHFEYYLRSVVKKNINENNEYLFINAWNEWGETNYLEPDERNGYQCLEVVKRVADGIKKKLSIIIPLYNVAEYVEDCLDSILSQSFQNYEVICVNDGSTDKTGKILYKYQKKYPLKILVHNIEHKGVSEARNYGMKLALGEFIYFVDADDILSKDALEIINKKIESRDVDIAFFSFENICHDKYLRKKYSYMLISRKRNHEILSEINGKEAFEKMWNWKEYYVLVWIQVVNRKFLEKNNIIFKQGIEFEDQLYTYQLLNCAKKVLCFDEIVYKKRIRQGSICTSPKSIKYIISYLQIYMQVMQIYKINNQFSQSTEELLSSYKNRIKKVYNELDMDERKQIKNINSDIENNVLSDLLNLE